MPNELDLVEPETRELQKFDYGEHAAVGFKDQRPEDVQIPFVKLLQGLSPEVIGGKNGPPIEGCKPGLFINSVTGRIYGEKLSFVPAHKQRIFVEWKPRTAGGGLVARHDVDSEIVQRAKAASAEFGKYKTEAGNDLVETVYVYGAVLGEDSEDLEPAILAFTSTKLSVFTRWNTTMSMFQISANGRKQTPPLCAHLTQLGRVSQTNSKGTYFNFQLSPARGSLAESLLPPDSVAFRAAIKLRDLVVTGKARAADEPAAEGAGEQDPVF